MEDKGIAIHVKRATNALVTSNSFVKMTNFPTEVRVSANSMKLVTILLQIVQELVKLIQIVQPNMMGMVSLKCLNVLLENSLLWVVNSVSTVQ